MRGRERGRESGKEVGSGDNKEVKEETKTKFKNTKEHLISGCNLHPRSSIHHYNKLLLTLNSAEDLPKKELPWGPHTIA